MRAGVRIEIEARRCGDQTCLVGHSESYLSRILTSVIVTVIDEHPHGAALSFGEYRTRGRENEKMVGGWGGG